ncbi:MAG: radical SAM family heme chaperone HemW [Syntrophales bacterium]|nr:radical SAM family heme chaperone HemW [Syntrophales bacterium]
MNKEAGLYLHIPFCRQKCPYCHFYSVTDLELLEPFLKGIKKEMEMYRGVFPPFSTLYIGGGSPSLIPARLMESLINAIFSMFSFQSSPEITVEVNPADQDVDWYRCVCASGVNRIIIGIQSPEDEDLTFLGRRHRAQDAFLAVEKARKAGFENIGIDLIYGLPDRTVDDWTKCLQKVVAWCPSHISCYELTLEEGTPLCERAKMGAFILPNEEMKWQLFEVTDSYLSQYGYTHYEVSNFARGPLFFSHHNLIYWRRKPYLGLGPSAHSFDGKDRWWNTPSLTDYLKRTKENLTPVAGKEELSPEDMELEEIFLGLRTKEGIHKEKGLRHPLISYLLRDGYVIVDRDRLIPTVKGMALADQLSLILSSP